MDPAMKQAVMADLDRFLKRKEYYRRIGKAWKRGYLLYGPPGTGKSSLVAAMANYLRFNLYDLDLSGVYDNSCLQRLLMDMPNKSILVIEDIDCSFDTMSREKGRRRRSKRILPGAGAQQDDTLGAAQRHRRPVVDDRRGAHHRLHHQLQGPPRPGAATPGPHGHARLHGTLWLGGLQDAGPELSPRRRPRSLPGDSTTACGGGGYTRGGVRDAAAE
uniref:ATPase AAA-type core domain-containing protein n=1 Tax=Aegilops tauschii subsp. strangulata TaxID=200361 RepID=A0A453MKP9_AEGTS